MRVLSTEEALDRLGRNAAVRRLRSLLAGRPIEGLYLVGGVVRDALLGQDAPDLDIVCPPDEVKQLSAFLSETWPCRLVLLNERWGTVRLVPLSLEGSEKVVVDLAPARGGGIEEDLVQRDFTVDAMAVWIPPDPQRLLGPLVDPAGGLRDLASGMIRVVHPDRFVEDPVRLLRAFRIASSLGFAVEPGTLEAIRKTSHRLSQPAAERLRDELFKLLGSPGSRPYLDAMDQAGLLVVLFPETAALRGLKQGPEHAHEAWAHSMETFRQVEKMMEDGFALLEPWGEVLSEWTAEDEERAGLLKLAALLHDIGKPATARSGEGGKVHFFGHDREGARLCGQIGARLKLSRSSGACLERWVRFHMWPLHLYRAASAHRLRDRARVRFFRRLGGDAFGCLILAVADHKAKKNNEKTIECNENFMQFIKSMIFFSVERDAAGVRLSPLIRGRDIMERFGLSPGPAIGRLLEKVHEARAAGEIANREQALDLVGRLIGKGGIT